MLATFAFDVCHEVYQAAREALDGKIATLNLESSGKYTWRPDRVPRMAEFVADFALAGERALGGGQESGSLTTIREDRGWVRDDNAKTTDGGRGRHTTIRHSEECSDEESLRRLALGETEHRREIPHFVRNDNRLDSGRTDKLVCPDLTSSRLARSDDFRLKKRIGTIACPTKTGGAFQTSQAQPAFSASRLVMFRMFYLGGAEYHAARRHLGISEFTWADWSEEIRARVGRELVHAGMFPPSKYFVPSSAQRAARKRDLRATG